jgi:hypothetical protein
MAPHAIAETDPATIDVSGLPETVVRDIRQLVETLRNGSAQSPQVPTPRKSLRGCLAGKGLKIPTLEELEEVRREMWANFPRDLPEPDDR